MSFIRTYSIPNAVILQNIDDENYLKANITIAASTLSEKGLISFND